jgi:hypothetical protein
MLGETTNTDSIYTIVVLSTSAIFFENPRFSESQFLILRILLRDDRGCWENNKYRFYIYNRCALNIRDLLFQNHNSWFSEFFWETTADVGRTTHTDFIYTFVVLPIPAVFSEILQIICGIKIPDSQNSSERRPRMLGEQQIQILYIQSLFSQHPRSSLKVDDFQNHNSSCINHWSSVLGCVYYI